MASARKKVNFVYGEQPTRTKIAQLYQIASQTAAEQPEGAVPAGQPGDTTDIDRELIRRERIQNDDAEQNIRLKKNTLDRLFLLLTTETALIFVVAMLQATHWLGFALEEWSFKLLTTATIAQITGMLFVAVRYLFPKKPKS